MHYESGFPLIFKNINIVKCYKLRKRTCLIIFNLKLKLRFSIKFQFSIKTFSYFRRKINMKKSNGEIRNNMFSRLFCWKHFEICVFTLAFALF